MSYSKLEDFFGDVVGKARRGQGLSEGDLARAAGLTVSQIGQIESYAWVPPDEVIHQLALKLGLSGKKLVDIAHNWVPDHPNAVLDEGGMRVDRLILDAGMQVNCYVLTCQKTKTGAVIDPGGEPARILSLIKDLQANMSHILLTHGHGDHVGALPAVAEATGATVCGCERDFGLMGGKSGLVSVTVDDGWHTALGALQVRAVSLAGHTAGGIGYLCGRAFFSGDALFAGSMGGVRSGIVAYRGQIDAVGGKVLSLPEDTCVFPGHGPITSVGQERSHNPFFVF